MTARVERPSRGVRGLIRREYVFLRRPVSPAARLLLLAAVGCLIAALLLPLWRIGLVAPQYQEGLTLNIYSYQLVAGNEGQDLFEINNLNHYIGMKPLSQADFFEMRWVPFALGVFILLCLRAAIIGTMGSLVDLLTLYLYFTAFSLGSFYYRLYTYGHDLDPKAPMTIEPFTPVLIGEQQIANFVQTSWPQIGSLFLALAPLCILAAMWLSRKEEPL
jgi:copper chaperone NosL